MTTDQDEFSVPLTNSKKFLPDASKPWRPNFWRASHLAQVDFANLPSPRVFGQDDVQHLDPALTLWDIWPVQLDNGDLVELESGSLWVMLSAPRLPDPDVRHNMARMRLLLKSRGQIPRKAIWPRIQPPVKILPVKSGWSNCVSCSIGSILPPIEGAGASRCCIRLKP